MYVQVWTEDGDGDDWQCAQTLAAPGGYIISFYFKQ